MIEKIPKGATHRKGVLYLKKGPNGYALYWNGIAWRESGSLPNRDLEQTESPD